MQLKKRIIQKRYINRIAFKQISQEKQTSIWVKIGKFSNSFLQLFFAGFSVFLAIKYGENTDQIEKLSKIIANQDIQLRDTKDLITKMSVQNRHTFSVLTTLVKQNRIISDQLNIEGKEYNRLTYQDSLNRKFDYERLLRLYYALRNFQRSDFTKLAQEPFLKTISELKQIMEQPLNPLIYEDENLVERWQDLYDMITVITSPYNKIELSRDEMTEVGGILDSIIFHIKRVLGENVGYGIPWPKN